MSKMPPGSGACCLPNADGITYLNVGGDPIDMRGLESIFRQLLALERRPEDASDEELVGMARKFNWITYKAAIEAEYAEALRKSYAAYYAQSDKSHQQASG
jgi:hypothetical protein